MKRKLFGLFAVSTLLVTVPVVAEAAPGKVDRPVNLRSAPSASEGSVHRTLQPGTKLEVLTALNAHWLKVDVGGKTGYVSASYVTYAKETQSQSAVKAAASSSVKTASSAGVKGTPSVKPISAAAQAPIVQATVESVAPEAAPSAAPAVVPAAVPANTGSGTVAKNVNFRAEPTTGSAVHRVLSAGEAFTAVELANSAWLKITDANGLTGYVSTSYVTYTLPGGASVSPAATPAPPAVDTAVPLPLPSVPLPVVPLPTPSTGSAIDSNTADRIIQDALSLQGITRYGFGKNEAPVLLDCSSFTRYVFGLQGLNLPFGTAYQKDIGIAVDKDQWQKGDLLFFWSSVPGLIGHVGIYNGEGGLVHNSASKDGVVVADLDLKYWQDHYVSARRVLQ